MSLVSDEKHKSSIFSSVFVARQPVFARDNKIWGYEVLFRSEQNKEPGNLSDFDDVAATHTVLSDGLNLLFPSLADHQHLLINFPAALLLDGTARLLPPKRGVVEILETVEPTPAVLEAVAQLKSEGYMIALDDFTGQTELLPFIPYIDLIKVEVLGYSYPYLQTLVKDVLAIKKVTLLAEKIENKKMLEHCRELGFDLFQGFYFAHPELKQGKKINPSEMAKLHLVQMLRDPEFNTREVARILQSDASLSLKLFRYINSAALELKAKVQSVEHALAILGSERMVQWLTVTVFSQLASDNLSAQVASNAALNAFFLNALAKLKNTGLQKLAVSPEGSFLFGLLSSIKPLMGSFFAEMVENLPIEKEVLGGLLYDTGPYGAWNPLIEGYARNDLTAIHKFCRDYGISEQMLNESYYYSSSTIHKMFNS